jgi:hypothetical protein
VLLPPLLLVLLAPDDEPLPLLPLVPDELPLPLVPELPPELLVVEPDELPLPEPLPLPPSSPDGFVDDEPPHAMATATPTPMDAVERILAILMKAILLFLPRCMKALPDATTSLGARPQLSTISKNSFRPDEGKSSQRA